MDSFLKECGYTLSNVLDTTTGDSYDQFQKRYVIDGRAFFINIRRYDMSPLYSRAGITLDPITYSIQSSFELSKDGRWSDVSFYRFDKKFLREKLDEYEKTMLGLWTILGAKGEKCDL